MKKLAALLIALMAFNVNAQITNNPTTFHNGIELPNISEKQTDSVLVVDEDGVVFWTDKIGGEIEISEEDGNTIEEMNDGLFVGQALGLKDVTQEAFQDKAIYVIPFNNLDKGMEYQEGSIDFSIITDENISYEMGLYSFSIGLNTQSRGLTSSAFGNSTQASGVASSSFGNSTEASGDYSSAFGQYSEASGLNSSAFGDNTEASGLNSSAFGSNTEASGDYSSAFGQLTKASGDFSSAFGQYTEANEYASLAIGRYSKKGTIETSWNDGSPILKVGNGTSNSNRNNAYTLYNDGRSEQEKSFEITTENEGIILKSDNGTRFKITVDDEGDLQITQL